MRIRAGRSEEIAKYPDDGPVDARSAVVDGRIATEEAGMSVGAAADLLGASGAVGPPVGELRKS